MRVRSKIHAVLNVVMFLLLFFIAYTPGVHAAVVSSPKDTLTREKISTAADHTIQFVTPTGIVNGNTVTLTFEAGFNIASVVTGDVTVEGAAVTSASPSGQVLTITCGSSNVVAASGTADIVISNGHITNPGSAGDYTITIGGTFGDTGVIAIPIVTDDQIAVTGDIGFSITFSLSTTTCSLGTLTTGAVGSCGPFTYTVGTTAAGGYTVTVQDEGSGSNPGLYKSATPTHLVASSTATLAAGTEGYGIQGAVNSGSQTIAAVYLKTSNDVGGLNRTATTISSYTSATSSNHVTNVTAKAAIAAGTYAGSYADTLTFLATGNF